MDPRFHGDDNNGTLFERKNGCFAQFIPFLSRNQAPKMSSSRKQGAILDGKVRSEVIEFGHMTSKRGSLFFKSERRRLFMT